MKVLSVIETLGRGGAERVLVNTLPTLQKLGIKCEVAIIFSDNTLAEELEREGIVVHCLNLSYKWNISEGALKLSRLVRKGEYDVIHAHLFFAYLYVGLVSLQYKKIKSVATFHNLAFEAYPANTMIKKLRKYIQKKIMQIFDVHTAVSAAVKDHYKMHLGLSEIAVIHNSFPINDFKSYAQAPVGNILEKYIGKKEAGFVVLTPGRFVKEKGHQYLIKAIECLNKNTHNMYFIFVGDGPLKEYLIDSLPANVNILNAISFDELMMLYKEIDMIVIPSVYEAFGLAVGEAMAMGKPIVATAVGGIPEMIEDGEHGILVPPRDPSSLAHAITSFYKNPYERKRLARNAKEKINQFDIEIIAKQWVVYYKNLVN